jgi:hypothetical protein
LRYEYTLWLILSSGLETPHKRLIFQIKPIPASAAAGASQRESLTLIFYCEDANEWLENPL